MLLNRSRKWAPLCVLRSSVHECQTKTKEVIFVKSTVLKVGEPGFTKNDLLLHLKPYLFKSLRLSNEFVPCLSVW